MLDLTRLISEMELGINIQLQFRAPDCETLENELITISGAHMGLVIELSQAVRILQEDDYELRSCLNQHNQNNNPNFGAFQIVRTKKRERIAKKLGVSDQILLKNDPGAYKNEMDSRADMTYAGINFRMIHDSGETADVSGFYSQLEAMENIPIGTCVKACTDPLTLMALSCLP